MKSDFENDEPIEESALMREAWRKPILQSIEMKGTSGGGADTDEASFPAGFPLNS